MDDDVKRVIEIIKEETVLFEDVLLAALSVADADEAAILLRVFPCLWAEVQPGIE